MAQVRADLRIRQPQRGDGPALLGIHQAAFRPRGASTRAGMAQLSGSVVVAELDGVPVGFGCWEVSRTRRAEPELRQLLACLEPTTRAILAPTAPSLPLPLRIEAPAGVHPTVNPYDWVFTALAVRPDLRRCGIGTALALARIDRARTARVSQVFVHCVDGSGSRRLYEKLGFIPLVTKDRHYSDGAGMTLLYLPLTEQP